MQLHCELKPFRIRTYEIRARKSFRRNTYKNKGGHPVTQRPPLPLSYCGFVDAARLCSSSVFSNSALARSMIFISLYSLPNW